MIRINLLPPAERQPKWRSGRIYLAIALLTVGLFFAFYGYNQYLLSYTQRQLAEVRSRYELLRPTEQAMQTAGAKQQAIDQKQAVLMKLTKERTSQYALLTQLGAKTPPELWLSELTVDKGAVKLLGNAKTYPDLAGFMRKLEQDDVFVEPALIKAEKDPLSPVTKFEMTVKIKGM